MNRWVPEHIKPETLLKAKMTKLKLSYFKQLMRKQGSLGKTIVLREKEGSRKRGGPDMR